MLFFMDRVSGKRVNINVYNLRELFLRKFINSVNKACNGKQHWNQQYHVIAYFKVLGLLKWRYYLGFIFENCRNIRIVGNKYNILLPHNYLSYPTNKHLVGDHDIPFIYAHKTQKYNHTLAYRWKVTEYLLNWIW